jgi:hypothetical protein
MRLALVFLPSFVKNGKVVQKMRQGGKNTNTHTQHEYFVILTFGGIIPVVTVASAYLQRRTLG